MCKDEDTIVTLVKYIHSHPQKSYSFLFSISEIEGIPCWCPSWRKVISFALQHCGMPRFNSVNTQMHAFWLLHAFCANILSYLQGKSADSLAHYFGEDPVRCPFEQGIFFWAERHNYPANVHSYA